MDRERDQLQKRLASRSSTSPPPASRQTRGSWVSVKFAVTDGIRHAVSSSSSLREAIGESEHAPSGAAERVVGCSVKPDRPCADRPATAAPPQKPYSSSSKTRHPLLPRCRRQRGEPRSADDKDVVGSARSPIAYARHIVLWRRTKIVARSRSEFVTLARAQVGAILDALLREPTNTLSATIRRVPCLFDRSAGRNTRLAMSAPADVTRSKSASIRVRCTATAVLLFLPNSVMARESFDKQPQVIFVSNKSSSKTRARPRRKRSRLLPKRASGIEELRD